MTWAEIKAIWKGGVSSYMKDGANVLDFAILALFWSYMVLTLISYFQVRYAGEMLGVGGQNLCSRVLRGTGTEPVLVRPAGIGGPALLSMCPPNG